MFRLSLRTLAIIPLALTSLVAEGTASATPKTTSTITVSPATLKVMLTILDFSHVGLSVSNGNVTLVPSPGLAFALAPNDPNSVADQTRTFNVGSFPLGKYNAVGTILGGQIDPGLTVTLGPSSIGVDTVIEGKMHVDDSIKNFDIDIAASIHVDIGVANGFPYVAGVSTTVTQKQAVDCGLLGWCDKIAQLFVNGQSFSFRINQLVTGQLDGLFQSPTGMSAWNAFLQSRANGGTPDPSNPAWTLVPGTAALANSALTFNVTRDTRPVPPSCSATVTSCDGVVKFTCSSPDGNPIEVAVQEGNNGTWSALSPLSASHTVAPFAFGTTSVNVKTCEYNAWAPVCSTQGAYVQTCGNGGPPKRPCNLVTHENCPVTPPVGGVSR